MIGKIKSFVYVIISSGICEAISKFLSFYGLDLDIRNALRFRDPKIAFSCDIKQPLPRTTSLPHPVGIVISDRARIGENVRIYQNVTIGWTLTDQNPRAATIHDNAKIYSGAVIIGDITIGRGSVVGANSVVTSDVEPNTTVAGAPAKEIKSEQQ